MKNGKILIAYFMVKGHEDSLSKKVAAALSTALEEKGYGSIEFPITPIEEYPLNDKDRFELVAKAEKDRRHRPALVGKVGRFQDYQNMILVTPNWFNDLPMGVYSFFDEYDFSGMRILPIIVHSSDGGKQLRDDIRHFVHKADVLPGCDVKEGEELISPVTEGLKQLLSAIEK